MAVMLKPKLLAPIFEECNCPRKECRCGAEEVGPGTEVETRDLEAFPRVLWIDPGTHTGWAILWFDPDLLFDPTKKPSRSFVAWWAGMVVGPENNHVDYLMQKMRLRGVGGEGLCCGSESFTVHSIKKEATFLSPARVAAAFEWAIHRGQREPDGVFRRRDMPPKQAPRDAFAVTDDILKMNQIYLPGAEHPRDATRHAVLWIRRLAKLGEDFYDHWHFADLPEIQEQQ